MCVYNWAIQSEFGLLGKKKKCHSSVSPIVQTINVSKE